MEQYIKRVHDTREENKLKITLTNDGCPKEAELNMETYQVDEISYDAG